jgi:hypothetical protein
MAWVRIHDGAMHNMKISALSNSAFRLWIRGLCYCQMGMTDGLIPFEALRDMGAKAKDVRQLNASLVAGKGPLWESIDGFGYKVKDYLFWNDSKEVIEGRQKKARDRLEKWRSQRVSNDVGNGMAVNTYLNQTEPNQRKSN